MKRIKFYGLGGQGVVTAAKTLSVAVSIYEDEYAVTIPAYGHERRGAPVYTDMVVDDEPILTNCFVYEPDVVVVMEAGIIDKHKNVDVGKGCSEDTIAVINTDSPQVAKAYSDKYGFKETYFADGTGIALKNIGRGIPNGPMLGAMAKTGIVKIESVEGALKEVFGKNGDKNARAAREAYESTTAL